MSVVYLVRHGQASFGSDDYDRLSTVGERQAPVAGAALRRQLAAAPHAVVVGTMRRHRQTADGALGPLPALTEDAGWNEYDHEGVLACWEPRYRDRAALARDLAAAPHPGRAFQELFGQAVRRWASGAHDADYAETWPAFQARVADALARLTATLPAKATAVVFTSGGPIAAVVASLLRAPDDVALRLQWDIVNASLTKLVVGAQGPRLSTFNDHGHFSGDAAALLTFR